MVRGEPPFLLLMAAAGLAACSGDPVAEGAAPTFWLSQTGLYSDIRTKSLAADLIGFEPTHALWSDGVDKQRWLRLSQEGRIDTSDTDHWQFPIGAMLFKEFARGGRRLETRLISRTGQGPDDYFMGAFIWNDDESDARYVPGGARDVRGTEHDVPSTKQCVVCHDGEPGRILGYSAVQQVAAPEAILSDPSVLSFRVPGDTVTARALGYLHANCGHCHAQSGAAWPDTDLDLRLRTHDALPEETASYRSSVGMTMSDAKSRQYRIVPGSAAESGVYHRMSERGPMIQMPPLATEQVDTSGLEAIAAWISALMPKPEQNQ